ncbi:MAG: DEAD/DEAH box helicase family protein [Candidatus Diapherotrites archaeon]|nr:DEAD/DEAH box helicase family protein [Candidatus Diapherotrites archaeon]
MPTGVGKTLVGLLFAEELARKGLRILVLEPTRILVEQTYEFYKKYSDLDVGMYHGLQRDEEALKKQVVITTPESALTRNLKGFDAVIVDECHHAVGDDPLKQFLEKCEAPYRLGLSAHVPRRHRKTIERLIGKILEWDYSHPSVKPFVPEWIAEVYEAPFNDDEMEVYKEIEGRMIVAEGREKSIIRLALVFFSRDAPLALKDSLNRKNRISELLGDLKPQVFSLRDLHKFDALKRVLEQHDFEKALIFIDRVVVAKKVAELVGAKLISGRKKLEEKRKELEEARKARIVVSTSAGEEGVDLPATDLLIIWSNSSSVLRFVQRRGRALRKAGRIPKTLVFIVTPDTVDSDLFVEGIYSAKMAGVDIGVLESLVEKYARMGTRAKILEFLNEPLPEEWIAELTGLSRASVRRNLRILCEEGAIAVVFTERGRSFIKTEELPAFAERRPELFTGGGEMKVRARDRKRKPPFYVESVVVKERRGKVEYVYTLRINCFITEEAWELLKLHYSTPEVYRTWG